MIILISLCLLTICCVSVCVVFILQRLEDKISRLNKISDNAIILLPQLDASLANIKDYGHMIGISASKGSKRVAWYMPVDAAVMFRDELIRVLKKDDCVLGKKGTWTDSNGKVLTHTDPPCELCELEKYEAKL